MNGLDYSIIAIYLAGLLFLGYAFRQQSNRGDYFLGGRSLAGFHWPYRPWQHNYPLSASFQRLPLLVYAMAAV
ncbi:hypothetical protein [Iodidimonas gelatinilytica]|uniref:hypothetical protein n=1 Tax=Iodidimonas gelatinilytica TaxID=1236966 RepID=UPI001B2FFDB3|nr:hypothetical protein [Iodidimonas gelatinilytica]